MKMTKIGRTGLGLALLALTAPAFSQLSVTPSGSLRIEGDSTLHKWSSTATAVSMSFTMADDAPKGLAEALKASKVKGMELKIAVAGLKSGESGLDKNMRKSMDAEKFPEVLYKLGKYELSKPVNGVVTAKTTGELTIAGKAQTISMDVDFNLGSDKAEAKGSYTLNMSDYGIKPPSLMLGAIKVRDPVTIRFDLVLSQDGAKQAGK